MAKIRPLNFIRQVKQEAKKVTWPSRKEVFITTGMVFILGFFASLFFLLVDNSISYVIKLLIG